MAWGDIIVFKLLSHFFSYAFLRLLNGHLVIGAKSEGLTSQTKNPVYPA